MNDQTTQRVSVVLILTLMVTSTACMLGLPALDDDGHSEVTPIDTAPPPTEMQRSTPASDDDLGLDVCWSSQVEPPQTLATITIEMVDLDANYSDWVVGDASEEIASGRLNSGESTTVKLEVDWATYPYQSSKMFYVYGRGDDGSTFAEVVKIHFRELLTSKEGGLLVSARQPEWATPTQVLHSLHQR